MKASKIFLWAFLITVCSTVAQAQTLKLGPENNTANIIASPQVITLDYNDFATIAVSSNYPYNNIHSDADWLTWKLQKNGNIAIFAQPNYNLNSRSAYLNIEIDPTYKDKVSNLMSSMVFVLQKGKDSSDKQLTIKSGTASQAESGYAITRSFDGDNSTFYHSPWSSATTRFPVTLTYTLTTDPDVNSQHWNPAKYPFTISRAGIALNYTPWLRQLVNDIDLAYLAGYYRIGEYSAISSSLRYFSLGEVYLSSSLTDDNNMTIKPYELGLDVAYSLMLSEKFSLAAGVRWIYSDMRYDYSEDSSPASAFAADLSAYYQNYINIGSRECQLGIGLNISNIGSKITFSGDEESQFIPTNMRLGASLMIPVDEYNRFSISADANKLLVPTIPKQQEGETTEDYRSRVISEYSDMSSITGIFKSFSDAPNGFKEELEEIQWSVGAEYTYHDQFRNE